MSKLPVPGASFVGRQREIAALARLLSSERLITLRGPGGCGKTRLAIEAARDRGVEWIDLSGCEDPVLVPEAFASALGVTERAGQTLEETIPGRVSAGMLLVDNCEHVLRPAADLIAAILATTPSVRILATSRERLGIAGEHVFEVPALPHPDPRELPDTSVIERYDAVRLFVERAAAHAPGFVAGPREAASIALICARLDGLPLAIELAAARVAILTPEQILARLDDRFALLSRGGRDAAPRQQTLRALVDWSYDLLSDRERLVLRRLAVFQSGCDIEAAERVCGPDDLLDSITSLAEKSLLKVSRGDLAARYHLLDTIRAFGLDKLREAGEEPSVRVGAIDWFIELLTETYGWQTADVRVLDALSTGHDDLMSLLMWAIDHDDASGRAVRMAGLLWRYWMNRGHIAVGLDLLRRALASTSGGDPDARARALNGAANLALLRQDPDLAWDFYEESLAIRRATGDRRGVANVLGDQASMLTLHGRLDEARSLVSESLAIAREMDNMYQTSVGLLVRGQISFQEGDMAAARRDMTDSLDWWRSNGQFEALVETAVALAVVEMSDGNPDCSRMLCEEALVVARDSQTWTWAPAALDVLGVLAGGDGDPRRAAVLFGAARRMRSTSDVPGPLQPIPAVEDARAAARVAIGAADFDEAIRYGHSLDEESSVGFALGTPAAAGGPDLPASHATLANRAGEWSYSFEGMTGAIRDSKGASYIARLVADPGREFHVADLAGLAIRSESHAGELLDETARRDLGRHIQTLRAEADQARAWGDDERAHRDEAEIEAITARLATSYGLGGRARTAADPVERARKAVGNRIRDAIARIADDHPALARHLRNAIRTGVYCSYAPDRDIRWTVTDEPSPR